MPNILRVSDVMSSRAVTVATVLGGDSSYEPAGFQRAYAWRPENAERLLEGIVEAIDRNRRHPWYHLGAITISPLPGGTSFHIADGQQRLVTLTILFALLRDLAGGDASRDPNAQRVMLGSSGAEGQPRLRLQRDVRETFDTYVQKPLGTLKPVSDAKLDEMSVSESNVIENRDALRKILAPLPPGRRKRISEFIANNCIVVVNEVGNEEDAREIFRIAHTTGIQLGAGDTFKADVLSHVPPRQRGDIARIWEEWQIKLGPERMHHLFECIRSLRLRSARHRNDVYADLIEHFRIEKNSVAFVHSELVPMASLYGSIIDGTIGGPSEDGAEIRRRLRYLEWLPQRDWMVPAFHLLRRDTLSEAETASVLRRLDHLAYMHFIVSEQVPERQRRYASVLGLIDAGRTQGPDDRLDPRPDERQHIRSLLSDTSLKPRRFRINVLRRINAAIDGGSGAHLDKVATIEHVMPKNPSPSSDWLQRIPDEWERKATVDMLGNLCLLAQKENVGADNAEFAVKRPILERSAFALAREAGGRSEWSCEVIRERTRWLIERLEASWS